MLRNPSLAISGLACTTFVVWRVLKSKLKPTCDWKELIPPTELRVCDPTKVQEFPVTEHPLNVVIIGGGPSACLLACGLAKAGHSVRVIEKRGDPRLEEQEEDPETVSLGNLSRKYSITLYPRGLRAILGAAELTRDDLIENQVIRPLTGRTVHFTDGKVKEVDVGQFQEQLYSIDRSVLVEILVKKAEKLGVKFSWDTEATDIKVNNQPPCCTINDQLVTPDLLVGADGAGSVVRSAVLQQCPMEVSEYKYGCMGYGYKMMLIPTQQYIPPPPASGTNPVEKDPVLPDLTTQTMHIWPGKPGAALPLIISSPTCTEPPLITGTLILPAEGRHSLATVGRKEAASELLQMHYSKLLKYCPNAVEQIKKSPSGRFKTSYISPVGYCKNNVVLIGDAAHTLVPFFGQGLNSALEDAYLLAYRLANSPKNEAVKEFSAERVQSSKAIVDMSVQRFDWYTRSLGTWWDAKKEKLMEWLHHACPSIMYPPLQSLVHFYDVPYHTAKMLDENRWAKITNCVVDLSFGGVISGLFWWGVFAAVSQQMTLGPADLDLARVFQGSEGGSNAAEASPSD
eukprot:TRINITY_DN66634_c7_g3_i1.p1 TRINITY_DN66634_c7_g3~~TRINITY_DN66634_c7_g3_i1.p1  ORF type:complete len:569 (+),score=54.06 TRINITY_DN66634_c7_g3_i1:122-1828(+)